MIFVENWVLFLKKVRKKTQKRAQIPTDFTDLHGICAQIYLAGPKINADRGLIEECKIGWVEDKNG